MLMAKRGMFVQMPVRKLRYSETLVDDHEKKKGITSTIGELSFSLFKLSKNSMINHKSINFISAKGTPSLSFVSVT